MNKIDYPFVKKLLLNKKNIVITTHKTPDGDALGSSLALWHTLKKNHNVHIIVPNEYPDNLKWLPGNNNVIIYENNKSFADNIITQSDIIFCLDFNCARPCSLVQDIGNKPYVSRNGLGHLEGMEINKHKVLICHAKSK